MSLSDEIIQAKRLFGISYQTSISRLKRRYKELLQENHPDKNQKETKKQTENTIEIIKAYKLLLSYAEKMPIAFSEDDIKKHLNADEFWMKHFGNDPIWGPPED